MCQPWRNSIDSVQLVEDVDGVNGDAILLLRQRYQEHLSELNNGCRSCSPTAAHPPYLHRRREHRRSARPRNLHRELHRVPERYQGSEDRAAGPRSWATAPVELLENIPDVFRSRQASSNTSARARIPPACSPARTPERTNKRFHASARVSPLRAEHGLRQRHAVRRRPALRPISTGRSATAASPSAPCMMPNSTAGSIC